MFVFAMADEDMTGVWYADDCGNVAVLTLDADGTASMISGDGYTMSGTWSLEGGKFVLETDMLNYEGVYADGKISVIDTLVGMIPYEFGRDMVEPLILSDAEVNADATAEDFNGSWSCSGYTVMDIKYRDKEGDELCTVENGTFTFSGANSVLYSWFGPDPVSFTFENSAYSYVLEKVGDESVPFNISMLQDGVMTISMELDSYKVLFYYNRIAQ